MLNGLDLFVSFKEYPFTFWLGVVAFSLWAGDLIGLILFGGGLRDLPSALKPVILLVMAALLTPMAVEAFRALVDGKPLPNNVGQSDWSVAGWPMWGLTAWISFVSMSIACPLYQMSEPVKEEVFASLPRPWIVLNYPVTATVAAVIYFGSVGGLFYIYSHHRQMPLFSKEHLALLSGAYAGGGLSLALLLRTFGANRWVSDVTALIAAGAITSWAATSLDLPELGWVQLTIVCSTATWALWGAARLVQDVIRSRKQAGGEPLSIKEQELEARLAHICPVCDREFVTSRGLNIHRARMHR